ncbi:unnamed protein product [Pieris macdunnoughi]|uniref:Uncharacterized protein n=1 Tax=Pieris macdunnoughi TaxID=345717 RepID=A0A821XBR3_9NEOP|nr:unnamed protein product [Pieris macdunnoughi]
MSAKKGKGPVIDSGICRCCGSMKKCRVLNVEYNSFGKNEVYSDMIMDCFGLLLSQLDSVMADRLVCAVCVHRIRDACDFRQQILKCEEAFLRAKIYDAEDAEQPLEPPKLEVKTEHLEEDDRSPSPTLDIEDIPLSDIKKEMNPLSVKPETKQVEEIKDVKTLPVPKKPKIIKKKCLPQPKLPMSMLQQKIREQDPSYTSKSNIYTIVENSFACPFRCRHNNLLCYYCAETFTDPELLRNHTISHKTKNFFMSERNSTLKLDVTRIDCRLCPTKINSLDEFKKHISSVHSKKFYFNAKDNILPFRLLKEDTKCAICDRTFPYFHALNRHMNEHYNNYVCELCGLGFVDRARFLVHQQRHEKASVPCEICGKVFRMVSYKEVHVDRVHNKKGRVYCPKCDVTFMSYQQKLKHLVLVHGEEPLSFPCNLCDRVFDTRRMFTIHKRKVHLKDFRYECQCCGQKFFTRSALNNHMPVHTGERNFKCKFCDKSYPRLKTLKDHIRIHTNDRRYRCHICGQAFIQNCSLKGHLKSQHPEYT